MLEIVIGLAMICLFYFDFKFSDKLASKERVELFFKRNGIEAKHLPNDLDNEISRFMVYSKSGIPIVVLIVPGKAPIFKHVEVRCYSFIENESINNVTDKSILKKDVEDKILGDFFEMYSASKQSFFLFPKKEKFEKILNDFVDKNGGVVKDAERLEKYEYLFDYLVAR